MTCVVWKIYWFGNKIWNCKQRNIQLCMKEPYLAEPFKLKVSLVKKLEKRKFERAVSSSLFYGRKKTPYELITIEINVDIFGSISDNPVVMRFAKAVCITKIQLIERQCGTSNPVTPNFHNCWWFFETHWNYFEQHFEMFINHKTKIDPSR